MENFILACIHISQFLFIQDLLKFWSIYGHVQVAIPLNKIKCVNQSQNVQKPTQKYIEIVTEDNFDFWFMGVLKYQKTFKYLEQAVSQA